MSDSYRPCPGCGKLRQYRYEKPGQQCMKCARPKREKPKRPPREKPPIEHGTRRGYGQHKAEGSQACDACLEARREYDREWREKNLVRRCVDCGERGAWKSLRNRCPACHRIFEEEDIGLTGGEWINDRGIQRWVWRDHA